MADRASADELQELLESAREWPLRRERPVLRDLLLWRAFRESDVARLKPEGWAEERPFIIDPLPERIAEAKADMIFGEEPDFGAGAEQDQAQLETLIDENQLPSELQSAAAVVVSEGEVWWRLLVDKAALDVPIVEFHSRLNVLPLHRGRRLLAVAFIDVIEEEDRAWRYVEIHSQGLVRNLLYQIDTAVGKLSGRDAIERGKVFGRRVPLTVRPEYRDLPDEWVHDLGIMLAGRVRNKLARSPKLGKSDYSGVIGLLHELNQAQTIGGANLKLTAKKRVVVSERALTVSSTGADGRDRVPAPVFDTSEEVFIEEQLDETLGSERPVPYRVLEYSFDASALIAWSEHLMDTILIRTRTAPQLVGRHTESAQTGPALRARLMDSILDVQGKARFWDDEVPRLLQAATLVDALPQERGGFGRSYSDHTSLVMERKSTLPEDEDARLQRHVIAVNAELESTATALRELHPEWTEERINAELEAIARGMEAPVVEAG